MKNWNRLVVAPSTPLLKVIEIIDTAGQQIALVVDSEMKLLGTVTDGDVRRALLRGVQMQDPIERVMNPRPTSAHQQDSRQELLVLMRRKQIRQLPILSEQCRLVGVETIDELTEPSEKTNRVVLMAGGTGTRLRPLTETCPKSMLPVGDRPLLETILTNFIEHGFHDFYFSLNYKADMIRDHFGDGSKWGARIRYVQETEALGTAGALSLLPERPTEPIFVMNGDLLTKVNFDHLLEFHRAQKATATMCVREFDFQVPYGVVRIDREKIVGIDEKPVQRFFVNAGIYVLQPEALDRISHGQYYDMPSLFQALSGEGAHAAAFPVREYWLDIGRMADLQRANDEYSLVFKS
jgi:dTDP-glucose pyrophosphorylase/predicted transcriptional regulator